MDSPPSLCYSPFWLCGFSAGIPHELEKVKKLEQGHWRKRRKQASASNMPCGSGYCSCDCGCEVKEWDEVAEKSGKGEEEEPGRPGNGCGDKTHCVEEGGGADGGC